MFHLIHKGRQSGPHSLEELRLLIHQGKALPDDLGWKEGSPDWLSLRELAGHESGIVWPPPVPKSHWHWTGMVSLVCGVVGGPCWFVLLGIAGIAHNQGHGSNSPVMIVVGLALFLGLAINLVAAALGGYGLTVDLAKKWPAITGLLLNLIQAAGLAGITVLGMISKGR